jgi:hypothetical protein
MWSTCGHLRHPLMMSFHDQTTSKL